MPYIYLDNYTKKNNDEIVAIIKGDNQRFNNKYLYLNTDIKKDPKKRTKIEIPEECYFNIVPPIDSHKRQCLYLCAASGAGKSYLCKTYSENYHKLFPNRPVYLISKLQTDETLDELEFITRLNIDDFILNKFDVNNAKWSNSLFIFDDYDCFEKTQMNACQDLIDQILTMGRRHGDNQGGISCIIISHHITNFRKTAIVLNECDYIITYPQGVNQKSLVYLLETYIGLTKKEAKKIKQLPSRWVCFHMRRPMFVLSQVSCELLFQNED